ncbi:MAG: hypothetical protein M3Y58_14280 [Chloroflexota bacterium]|nr:hypothetical protein [Chloroflexota bacterium]
MATQDIQAIIAAALADNAPTARKAFVAAKTVGGTAASSLFAHPAEKGTGIKTLGYDPELAEPQDLGIEIAVADAGATVASTAPLEEGAIEAINLLPGYRATRHAEGLLIETESATAFDPEDVATVIAQWLAQKYGVQQFAVRLIFGPPGGRSVFLRDLRGQAYAVHQQRAGK